MKPTPPYIKNCHIIKRDIEDAEVLFRWVDDMIYPYLDGYTIIPTEQYEELKNDST